MNGKIKSKLFRFRDTLNGSSGLVEQVIGTDWTGHRDRLNRSSGQIEQVIGTECPGHWDRVSGPSGQSVRRPSGHLRDHK